MTDTPWAAVDDYIATLFLRADPALDHALEASARAGLPAISVSPPQGKLLSLLTRAQRARTILEIGTLGGYSTIWLARALPADGRLITLELDPKHAEVARANVAHAGLGAVVDVRVGPAADSLRQLVAERHTPFDLIFIDADKPGYPEYLAWSLKLARRGTVIIADNVVRKGEIANASSTDANVRAMRRFNDLLAAEPRLDTTVIQTVGGKGYDGFAFALVTADA